MPTLDIPYLLPFTSLLVYGPTGAGKSLQAARLAEYIGIHTGKKTIVFLADEQGSRHAYAEHPFVERIITPEGNPWLWMGEAMANRFQGKPAWTDQTGLIIHESLKHYAELVKAECSRLGALGVSIGGGGAHNVTLYPPDIPTHVTKRPGDDTGKLVPKRKLTPEEEAQTVEIGSSNMTHYGVSQEAIDRGLKMSRGPVPTLFTSLETLAKPKAGAVAQIGPMTVGDAQVSSIPPLVTYTFRLYNTDGKVTLHLKPHNVGPRTEAMANARIPLRGKGIKIPDTLTGDDALPAALELLWKRRAAALEETKALVK